MLGAGPPGASVQCAFNLYSCIAHCITACAHAALCVQSTSSTERAGLLGTVAALGDALLNLGASPASGSSKEGKEDRSQAFTPTPDGHIQLPPGARCLLCWHRAVQLILP